MKKPQLIVSADWSKDEKKRWMVRAELVGDHYVVFPPEPVGEHNTLISRLRSQIGDDESALLGFDFPIGLPSAFAAKAGFKTFLGAILKLGTGDWSEFYQVSDNPRLHQPFAPLPKKKGEKGFNRTRVATALGFDNPRELLRQCDQKTSARSAAEILFYTLGGKQVGAGAVVGWRDVIAPNLDTVNLWPFEGGLVELLTKPGIAIAEIYPGEAYSHLDIKIGPGTGLSKTRRPDRRQAFAHVVEAKRNIAEFSNVAISWIEWGFLYEDDFDAMAGLLSMIQVINGKRACDPPENEKVREIEGWILGQIA